MKTAFINDLLNDEKMNASDYRVSVVYADGTEKETDVTRYAFSDVFEVIKERHEGENNQGAKKIVIELVR